MTRCALLVLALLSGCSTPPAVPARAHDFPPDTLAFERLGALRLGMEVRQAERVVGSRDERLECRLLEGRFLCAPERAPAVGEPYSLMFERDTLALLGWRRPGTLEVLRARYASLGTLAASGPASDTGSATLSLWLNGDSTAERMAICTRLRDEASCSVTLTRSDPAEVADRIERMRATFAERTRLRSRAHSARPPHP